MGLFDSFFHPERGYEQGQGQLDKYYQQMMNAYQQGQGFLQPYQQQGQSAFNPLNEQFMKLLNPGQLQNEWAAGYQESPYAKQLEDISSERGLNAAQSMGLNGSNTALSAIQQGTSQIANQDRQQYMNDMMQKYLTGLGLGQNFYNTGANAAGQANQNAMGMGNQAMNMGNNSAQMAFGQQTAPGSLFGNLLGTAGSIGGGILGGMFGGPMGAMAGSKIGGGLGGGWNLFGGK